MAGVARRIIGAVVVVGSVPTVVEMVARVVEGVGAAGSVSPIAGAVRRVLKVV